MSNKENKEKEEKIEKLDVKQLRIKPRIPREAEKAVEEAVKTIQRKKKAKL